MKGRHPVSLRSGSHAVAWSLSANAADVIPNPSTDSKLEKSPRCHRHTRCVDVKNDVAGSLIAPSRDLWKFMSALYMKAQLISVTQRRSLSPLHGLTQSKESFPTSVAQGSTDELATAPSLPQGLAPRHTHQLAVSNSSSNIRAYRVSTADITCGLRAYTTSEQSNGIEERTGMKLQNSSPSQASNAAQSSPVSNRESTARRFSHRRGAQSHRQQQSHDNRTNTGRNSSSDSSAPTALTFPHETVGASNSQSPSSSFPSHKGAQSDNNSRKHSTSGNRSRCCSGGRSTASTGAPRHPSVLRNGKGKLQSKRLKRKLGSTRETRKQVEEVIIAEWGDLLRTTEDKTADVKVQAHQSTVTQRSTKRFNTAQRTSRPTVAPSIAAPCGARGTVHSPPFYLRSSKTDCAPLRRLLRDHETYAKNFTTLKNSTGVVAALERLGTEAVARSDLLEGLSNVFAHTEEEALSASVDGATHATITQGRDAKAACSVHLVVTHLSVASTATQRDGDTSEVATLEVSPRVIAWLNSPIEMPSLAPADMVASVEKSVAHLMTMKTRTIRESSSESTTKVRLGERLKEYEDVMNDGVRQWYAHWGQQQHREVQLQSEKNTTAGAFSPSLIDSGMSQWYKTHVVLSPTLLRRCLDVSRSLALDSHVAVEAETKDSTNSRNGDESRVEDWRVLPRTMTSPDGATQLMMNLAGAMPPTRPDQTVSEEMLVLLRKFHDLLQTLIDLKSALEGQRLMAHYAIRRTCADKDSSSFHTAQIPLNAESGFNNGASTSNTNTNENDDPMTAESAFAELQNAVLQLQQVGSQHVTGFSSSSSQHSTSILHEAGDAAAVAVATSERVLAARTRVRLAGDRWLSRMSRVDVVKRVHNEALQANKDGDQPQTHEKVAFTPVSPLSKASATAAAATANLVTLARTPSFTITALDLLISVFLRCLLFYTPALPFCTLRFLMQCLSQPWIPATQRVPVAMWTTQLAITSLLSSWAASVNIRCDDNVSESASQTGGGVKNGTSERLLLRTINVALSSVHVLRSMCWPTVLDYRSKVVQRLLGLPSSSPRAAQYARATSVGGGAEAEGPSWKGVANVLQSTVEHQCLIYELMLLFLTVVHKANVFAVPTTTSVHPRWSGQECGREDSEVGQSADNAEGALFSRSLKSSQMRRNLALGCLLLIDVDCYMNEHIYKKLRSNSTYPARFLLVPSSSVIGSKPLPCMQAFELQITPLYGLARQTFNALHKPLLEMWPRMPQRRKLVLWDAFRYAVVAPAASVMFAVPNRFAARSTEERERVFSATRTYETAEWRAAGPVLQSFSESMTPTAWKMMWSNVSAELSCFPGQVRDTIQPTAVTQKNDVSSNRTVSLADREALNRSEAPTNESNESANHGESDALSAYYAQLSELTLLCAWLLVAAKYAFPAAPPTSNGELATSEAVLAECEHHVSSTFAVCVKSVLAVWTEAGTAAEAGKRLLRLLNLRAASTSEDIVPTNSGNAPPYALLLSQLVTSVTTHLWTTTLEELVRGWETQTRLAQEQVRQPLTQKDAGRTHDDDAPMHASKEAADIDHAAAAKSTPLLRSLQGLEEVDPCLRSWWRSLQAEDAELPSVHVYLLQVFTELRRIVKARRGEKNQDEALLPTATAASADHESLTENSATGSQEHEAILVNEEAMHHVAQTKDNGELGGLRAAASFTLALPSVFSPTELVVILRMLTSISTRGGLSTANSYLGASLSNSNNSNSSGGSGATSATSPSFGRTGSIMDAFYRVALHTAATRETSTTAASSTTGDAGSANTATTSVTSSAATLVDKSTGEIEQALLRSIHIHAASLPAASLLEAVWLGLYPLSCLSDVFYQACTQSEDEATLSANASKAEKESKGSGSLSHNTQFPTLRASSSEWLRSLHTDICTSAHTRLLCCFLLYRHYNVLCLKDDSDLLSDSAGAGSHGGTHTRTTLHQPLALILDNDEPAQVGLIAGFLELIAGSCTEALVNTLETATAASTSDVDKAGGNEQEKFFTVVNKGKRTEPADMQKPSGGANYSSTPAAAATEVSVFPAVDDKQQTTVLLKDQARFFLQVFVLSTEMHCRLSALEARRGNRVISSKSRLALVSSDIDVERDRRALEELYRSLLAAAEAYLPFGERGYCTEVVQMTSLITWRMRDLGLLNVETVLSEKTNGVSNSTPGSAASTTADVPAERMNKPLPYAHANMNTGIQLLSRYRIMVQALMPYVDAEVLASTKTTMPLLLKLAVITSAKAAVEHSTQGLLVTSEQVKVDAHAEQVTSPVKEGSSGSPRAVEKQSRAVGGIYGRAENLLGNTQRNKRTSFTALPTLSFARNPIWSQIPFEVLLHRVASERHIAARHSDMFCAMAVLTTELASTLLPIAHVLRDRCHSYDAERIELSFMALAVCATAFQRQSQDDMYERESVSLLSTAMNWSAAGTASHSARGRADQVRHNAQHATGSISTKGDRFPTTPTASALRVGEVYLRDLSYTSSRLDNEKKQQHQQLPIYGSPGALPTIRETSPQLRRTWVALSRRVLESESDFDLRRPSLWLTALYCGGALGVAETQLFEQLLASFVFNPVAVEADDERANAQRRESASQDNDCTRIRQLNAMGWTLLLEACATASHHCYRQGYRYLLKDELIEFLNRLGVFEHAAFSSSSIEGLFSSAGPAVCALLETIPKLFIEDTAFWNTVVKSAVVRCCEDLNRATTSNRDSNMVLDGTLCATQWAEQWKRSFNWAVTSAGHPSLAFPDVWTDPAQQTITETISKEMDRCLRDLKELPTFGAAAGRVSEEGTMRPSDASTKYMGFPPQQ